MKQTLLILTSAILVGCSMPKSNMETTPWIKSELVGMRFSLVAADQVEELIFAADQGVRATIGTEEAVTGPLMSWRLNPDGALVVWDDSTTLTLRKVKTFDGTVDVLRNGKPATYKKEATE